MKIKYQVVLPLALPLALALSVVYTLQGRIEANSTYQDNIRMAQEYEKNDVFTDAVSCYEAAIAIHPTLEAYLAIGQLYVKNQDYYAATRWFNHTLLSLYPTEPAIYEFAINAQLAQDKPQEAFRVYDMYTKRNLHSDSVEAAIHTVWYSFDLMDSFTDVRDFSNGTFAAAVQRDEKWGIIDAHDESVLPVQYQQIGNYDQRTPVVDAEGNAYFVDANGDKKLTPSFFLEKDPDFGQITAFSDISNGLVLAYNGEIWNYYDEESCQKKFGGYKAATIITNGVGGVSKDGTSWALISTNGQEITGYDYKSVVSDNKGVVCRTNAIIVEKNGSYMMLDRNGQQIGQASYQDARAFADSKGMAAVKKDGRWIFVDESGAEQDLGDFEDAKSFSAGVAAAKVNGKWGYINNNGEWVIEPQFVDAGTLSSAGVSFVKVDEKYWKLLSLYQFNHD